MINMTAADYTTTIVVDKPAGEVFDAINNVRGWWQGEIEGHADKPGDEFTYRMQDIHISTQKVVECIPGKKIVWLVTDSQLNFTKNQSEWTGTHIVFELSENNNSTELRFTHQGLVSGFECFKDCSNGWQLLIHESLLSLINTGKGTNVFG
jgi:hypothetical protein